MPGASCSGSKAYALRRIFVGEALGAGKLIHACVGSRIHYIVLYVYGLALFGAYHGHGVVAVGKILGGLAGLLLNPLRGAYSLGVHGYEYIHLVASMNVEQLAGGAHTVCGIYVAAVFAVVIHTPVLPIGVPEVSQIVYIAALYVHKLAEKALLSHVQGVHFKEVVHAVFRASCSAGVAILQCLSAPISRRDSVPPVLR